MKNKIFLLLITIFTSFTFSSKEVFNIQFSTSNYGSHLTTPFDMNHHVTTYMDTNTGYLYVAGDNRYYNLGNNTTTNSSLYFPAYKDGDSEQKFINPIDWDFEIFHSAIVDSDGSLWMVGSGTSGMLATGNTSTLKQFTQVSVPDNKKVKKVCTTRGYSTIILLEDDSVYTIGNTTTTGISGSTSAWVQVDTLFPEDDNIIVDFQGGEYASLYLTEKGNLYSVGTTSVAGGSSSFTVPKLTNVCGIDLMYTTSFAIKNDGTIWGTGSNTYGQLGTGDKSTKSTFTQANLSMLDGEFPVMIKGGIYTGYILTNLGNMYIAGSDMQGQYGDGTTNSVSSYFQLIHEDVAYFDVGEYQTGVLFKDSSLKFFGQNDFGQLGIGTTTNVHDAYSDEAKLVSPLAEGLGSGLIPAVTLATYSPNLDSWPSECVSQLTSDEILEYSQETVPIRPGQEHEDGSTNTFTAEDGGVYIFSSPAIINSKEEITTEIIFNSSDYVEVFYEELNLDSGVLKDYTVDICIKSDNNLYENSFNYGTEQSNRNNYPIEVGMYTVTTTLLNSKNEIKTTTETSYEITNATYEPTLLDNNLKDSLESIYIVKDFNNIDLFNSSILNGINNGTFFVGDFVQVDRNLQTYITGNFSDLTTNEITILYSLKGSNNYISEITDKGNYTAYVKIEPLCYTSSFITIDFTISEDKLLIHNDILITSDIVFGNSYVVDTNNSIISDNQKLYIQFYKDNQLVTEFEATLDNINNFNLYPKNSGDYTVSSVIKEDTTIISTKSIDYTIEKQKAILSNSSDEYIQQDDFTIEDIINHYLKNNRLSINDTIVTTTLVVNNFDYIIEDNNYIIIITNSNNEVVENISKTDTYTISISLDNDNYDTNVISFNFSITISSNFNPLILLIFIIPIILLILFLIKRRR